eukprot:TRINITY_DN5104_c0_g1_i1.p1 TRINITY_DN5104_c0_g1~~TRINITY_DN5104_c0_g1_i1.p1  ORF type:complete len:355 (+),score=23.81 TRINITY_DN5104_c0_g1_i1:615-1679(+)
MQQWALLFRRVLPAPCYPISVCLFFFLSEISTNAFLSPLPVGNRTMTSIRLIAALLLGYCTQQAASKVVGLTIDVEDCSGLGPPYHNVSTQLVACQQYFEQLQNFTKVAHGAGLKMSADAGTGWACPGEGFPPVKSCFNISFGGKNVSVAEHVVDLVDTAVLMDYTPSLKDAQTRAAPYFYYADTIPGKSVVIGLAIASPTQPRQWFETVDERALLTLMDELASAESHHPSFRGFSVFTSENWYNNSRASPYKGPYGGPINMWYIDNDVVFDKDIQDEWLSWAVSRNITGWYISTHKADRPFIGGNHSDEMAFCDFLNRADSLKINFEFFTSLADATALDIPFIRSCEKNGLRL